MTTNTLSGRGKTTSALRKLGSVLLILILLGLGLWWQRSAIVQWLLQQTVLTAPRLAGLIFDGKQTEIGELGFGLTTGVGDLAVELKGLRATYDLQVPKIQDIDIAEAKFKLSYQPAEAAKASDDDKPFSLPLDSLRIAKLVLEVDTPWGLSQFAGALAAERGADNSLTASFQDDKQSLRIALTPGFGDAKLNVGRAGGGKILELQAKSLKQPRQSIALNAELSALADWLNGNPLLPNQLQTKLATAHFDD